MKLLKLVLALGLMTAYSQAGQAQATLAPDGSVGQCWMRAKVRIASTHLIVGGSEGWGRGKVICNYIGGGREELPILIHTEGVGIGLGASEMEARMISAGFGVSERGARGLLGSYASSKVNVAIGPIGGEFSIGLALQRDQQAIPVDLKGKVGVGLEANIDIIGNVTLLPDDGRKLPQPTVYFKD